MIARRVGMLCIFLDHFTYYITDISYIYNINNVAEQHHFNKDFKSSFRRKFQHYIVYIRFLNYCHSTLPNKRELLGDNEKVLTLGEPFMESGWPRRIVINLCYPSPKQNKFCQLYKGSSDSLHTQTWPRLPWQILPRTCLMVRPSACFHSQQSNQDSIQSVWAIQVWRFRNWSSVVCRTEHQVGGNGSSKKPSLSSTSKLRASSSVVFR